VAAAVKQIPASHRLALTGTPVENSLVELWSIFEFLMPGFLGKLSQFKTSYAGPALKDREDAAPDRLARRVKPFISRRLKSQVATELPERIEQNIYCELTPLQKRMYRELVAVVRRDIDREIGAKGWEKSQICVLAALLRLRQLCCHPLLVDKEASTVASGKMEAFLETLATILDGQHRVIVFSQFVQMLKIIEKQLLEREIPYLYLDGQTRDRTKRIKEFQEAGKHSVFLMSLKAGGTGVNLTAADYVVLYDPWWNPAVENQAIDRTHRIGQTRTVTAYRMIIKDTLEEKMLQLKARKQDLADRILASDSEFLRGMTREDLEELLVAD
jgi:non-specific serine/threonine protein kinase